MNGAAGLETDTGAVLPPGNRTPLGVNETLFENMVEDILKVKEAHDVANIEELSSDLLVGAGGLVIGDPELSRLGLGTKS